MRLIVETFQLHWRQPSANFFQVYRLMKPAIDLWRGLGGFPFGGSFLVGGQ